MSLRALGLAVSFASLAALPAAAQTVASGSDDGTFVSVEGGKLWYQTCGAGPKAMVLIHDGTLYSATWDDVWPIFCKDFHVVRYDRRGYGRSPAATQSYSRTDDVAAVMRAAGMDHAVVVGASAGGGIAVDFTLAHPRAVDRLILVGPSVSGLRYSQYFNKRVMEYVRQYRQGDIEGSLRSGWSFAPGHDAALAKTAALLKANPPDLMRGDPARLAPVAKPLLSSMQTPTLVLVGDHDIADNQGEAAVAEALIPHAYRIVVPDSGHLMFIEHPDLFARLVDQFVDEKPHPDREASVRRYVASLEKGAPNYDEMVAAEAAEVRQELPQLVQLMKELGALKSVTYEHGTEDGADVYLVAFEHGQAEWTIGPLTPDGKVEKRQFRLLDFARMGAAMVHNYLVTALRNFARHKLYSAINIAGLTVGLTCAIFILLLVRDELSYDKWIPGTENVFRIQGIWSSPGGKPVKAAPAPFPVADAMAAEIPEVRAAAHLEHYRMTVASGDRQFIDAVDVVSPNFFQIIQLPLIQGDPARVFSQPESVVLSQSAARKYFGGASAMGKTLHVVGGCNTGPEDNDCIPHEGTLMVTGVMRDLPHNTQLTGEVFFPNSSAADPMTQSRKRAWLRASGFGYVALRPGADVAHVETELVAMVDRDSDPKKVAGLNMTGSEYWMPVLGSFRGDHLSAYEDDGLTPAGSWTMITGFASIGVLILLVACFNFTNLATAQAMVRAKEISLRKVLGARRRQLAAQFLGEAMLIALVALALALSLAEMLLPAFDRLVGKPIVLDVLRDWPLTMGLVTLAALTGLVAGAYPAAILSGLRPVSALRTSGAAAQRSGLVRTLLVVLQFSVSIGLGIAALVVFEQTSFARTLSLGLDKDGVVVVAADSMTQGTRQSFVRALDAEPALNGAALSGDTPFTDGAVGAPVQIPGEAGTLQMRFHMIGPGFLSVYRIALLAGRGLSESRPLDIATGSTDRAWNILINRAAAKRYFHSPDDALGKSFDIVYPANKAAPRQHLTIVGVTDDFKYSGGNGTTAGGLGDVVPAFYFDGPQETNSVSVRVPAIGMDPALSAIDRIWHQFAPSVAIDRHFLDQDFQNLFAAQEKQERIFALFVLIAIAIAAMGLFGMAALSTGRRTREIGLRKAFGARTGDIILLLLWQFSVPVLMANLLAWPVAYFTLRHWLDGYAYRISLGPLYFVGAGLAALAVAWATVIFHAARVARANPVHALRYE